MVFVDRLNIVSDVLFPDILPTEDRKTPKSPADPVETMIAAPLGFPLELTRILTLVVNTSKPDTVTDPASVVVTPWSAMTVKH